VPVTNPDVPVVGVTVTICPEELTASAAPVPPVIPLALAVMVGRPGATMVFPAASVVATENVVGKVPVNVPETAAPDDEPHDGPRTVRVFTFASRVTLAGALTTPCVTPTVGVAPERTDPVPPEPLHAWIVYVSFPG
jgi:hypothetical protein